MENPRLFRYSQALSSAIFPFSLLNENPQRFKTSRLGKLIRIVSEKIIDFALRMVESGKESSLFQSGSYLYLQRGTSAVS